MAKGTFSWDGENHCRHKKVAIRKKVVTVVMRGNRKENVTEVCAKTRFWPHVMLHVTAFQNCHPLNSIVSVIIITKVP